METFCFFILKIMKKILIIFILIFSIKGFSQDSYFLGRTNYCTPQKAESKKSFETSFLALKYPKYYGGYTNLLMKTAKEDPNYCDAYFMAGYFFRLQDMHKEALALYYIADSLAQNKALIFKQNLAVEFMRFDQLGHARKTYAEMIKYFPESPEGYYGMANTTIIVGDYDNGLEHLRKAEKLYKNSGSVKDDVKYMFGALYTFKEDYKTALPYLDEVYSTYKKEDVYLSIYALAEIKVGTENNDDSLKKKAKKHFEKIKEMNKVPENLQKKLKEYFY